VPQAVPRAGPAGATRDGRALARPSWAAPLRPAVLTSQGDRRTLGSVITSDVQLDEQSRAARPVGPSAARRSEQVATLLLEAIFAGRWAAGARLPAEDQLATELGAGRSSIREAIKALE